MIITPPDRLFPIPRDAENDLESVLTDWVDAGSEGGPVEDSL